VPEHESSNQQMTIYRSQARLATNPFGALSELAQELWRHRWHISTKYSNSFRSRFEQTVFGMVWQFLEPLLPISAYALLAYIAVFPTRNDMPALVYIAIGITLWMLMTDIVTRQMSALQSNSAILNRTKYPLVAVLAEAFAQSAFETFVRVLAVVVIFALMVGLPPWQALLALPMLLPPLLLAVGAGMILSVLNAVYRDVENITQIVLRYGFFLSLTIFPLPAHPTIEKFLMFNPLAVFIEATRNALVFGSTPDPIVFGVWSGISILVFVIGANIVYVMEPRLKGFL
jgi:lipopolysaccharide transport system permease protein